MHQVSRDSRSQHTHTVVCSAVAGADACSIRQMNTTNDDARVFSSRDSADVHVSNLSGYVLHQYDRITVTH